MTDTRTIFFLGKPGCGKGTQAKLLSEHTGWNIISSGAQFRKIAAKESPVGRKVKNEIDAGLLAPHWFAMYLFQEALFSLPEGTNIVFDGFNRKPAEARLIVDSLAWLDRPFTVINLLISDDLVYERVMARSRTAQRGDDNSIETRLEEYRTYTEEAIELFRKAGSLVDIDGSQDKDVIAQSIRDAIHV